MYRKEKKSNIQFLVAILFLAAPLSLFNYNLFNFYSKIALYFNYIIIILVLLFHKKIKRNILKDFMYIFLFVIIGVISMSINGGGVGSILVASYLLISIVVLSHVPIDNLILKILSIVYLLLLIYYTTQSQNAYTETILNQNTINSNTMGAIFMYTSMYLSIYIKSKKFRFKKIIIISIYLLGLLGTINAESRSMAASLLLFGFLYFIIPTKIFYKKKIMLGLFITLIIIGLIFPISYLHMYKNGQYIVLSFTNKSLYSGRETLWLNLFNSMDSISNWLFGLGSKQIIYANNIQNLHNTYLAILTNFGILGFILYYTFILKKINDIYKYEVTDSVIGYLLGFSIVFFNGNFETTFLWGAFVFFPVLFIVLASNNRIN